MNKNYKQYWNTRFEVLTVVLLRILGNCTVWVSGNVTSVQNAFVMWWHTRRNQISSFGETDELNWMGRGRQFSRLLAAEVCASAVVMLDTPSSEVVWRVLDIQSIRQFPLHFPFRASPCAITFQLVIDVEQNRSVCTLGFLTTLWNVCTVYQSIRRNIPENKHLQHDGCNNI
jgi:hypothetical protein